MQVEGWQGRSKCRLAAHDRRLTARSHRAAPQLFRQDGNRSGCGGRLCAGVLAPAAQPTVMKCCTVSATATAALPVWSGRGRTLCSIVAGMPLWMSRLAAMGHCML